MIDRAKELAKRVLTSKRGNQYAIVRIAKDLALFAGELVESAFAPDESQAPPPTTSAHEPAAPRGPAPVVVYADQKSRRDLDRIAGVLRGRDVAYQVMDVEEDRSTADWARRTAKVEDLPAVFIAGEPVGGFDALVQLDVSGELARKVFGG